MGHRARDGIIKAGDPSHHCLTLTLRFLCSLHSHTLYCPAFPAERSPRQQRPACPRRCPALPRCTHTPSRYAPLCLACLACLARLLHCGASLPRCGARPFGSATAFPGACPARRPAQHAPHQRATTSRSASLSSAGLLCTRSSCLTRPGCRPYISGRGRDRRVVAPRGPVPRSGGHAPRGSRPRVSAHARRREPARGPPAHRIGRSRALHRRRHHINIRRACASTRGAGCRVPLRMERTRRQPESCRTRCCRCCHCCARRSAGSGRRDHGEGRPDPRFPCCLHSSAFTRAVARSGEGCLLAI